MIYIASDHAGFELKKFLIEHLRGQGKEVEDCGAFSYDKLDDYPDFIFPCAQKVAAAPQEHRGIVIGWSGQGEAIVANKVKGIRALVYYGPPADIITLSRKHNDANVLALSAGFVKEDEAAQVVDSWLATEFSGEERHVRRIQKIADLEKADKST